MQRIILLALIGAFYCLDDYDGLDPTGGVSKEIKLKLVDTYKSEDCGMKSKEDDTVHWNYKGMLLDGTVFDQGKFQATLGHGHVIIGVDKGMRDLCVGDKRRMTMHSDWAYGDDGIKGSIPPKATLIFDVELTSIERNGEMETLEAKLAKTGGVSKSNKLKIEDLSKMEDCGMITEQDDTIHWNYVGTLLSGKVFDQGKFQATLGHGHVITGVDKGMRGLCVGDKRRMIIHPDWAYGNKGYPGAIPPNSVLTFEVELTSIERKGKVETLEQRLKRPDVWAGSNKGDKLKIEIQHQVEGCTLRSAQNDHIKWHYRGTFTDGSDFHSGLFEATLGHGDVIKGVDKGMREMCVGDKRRIIIHSDWAYGEQGRKGSIPPRATLIFDVEMLEIKRPNNDGMKSEL